MIALVTGSAGFLGRHFVRELARRGYRVVQVDPADPYGGDLTSMVRISQIKYDLVVHCGARSPHRKAIDTQPAAMVYNQMLDALMFDWATRARPGAFLYISSSAVYPVGLQTVRAARFKYRLTERDTDPSVLVTDGQSAPDGAYGVIKRNGEHMADLARASGVPVYVVRPFSGYGEDQSPDFPFGRFVQQIRGRDPVVKIWGDGHQVRDWIHVDDVVNGALAVVGSGITQPVNLCTGVGTSMISVVTTMTKAAGYTPQIEFVDGPRGVAVRVGEPSLMKTLYTPKICLAEGVDRAITRR